MGIKRTTIKAKTGGNIRIPDHPPDYYPGNVYLLYSEFPLHLFKAQAALCVRLKQLLFSAFAFLPEEDRTQLLEAQKAYRILLKKFTDALKALDPSLLKQYLHLEEAATDLFTYRADAMYLKGVMEEHVDLRMQGWTAP